MWKNPEFYFDLVTEFVFNGTNFMIGLMWMGGSIVQPTKGAWTVAILMGLIGASNHARALRKSPSTS